MPSIEPIPLIAVGDYLTDELNREFRHEFVDGYIYPREESTNLHSRIACNFLGSLGHQLRGKGCLPFGSETKVRIDAGNRKRFYYPDGFIVREPNGPDDTFQDKPVVIAEVLSDSTRRTDQLEKRDAYLTIPSLAVYLLIETDKPEVSVYRRDGEGSTTELNRSLDATIPLAEVEAELPLIELYERVELANS